MLRRPHVGPILTRDRLFHEGGQGAAVEQVIKDVVGKTAGQRSFLGEMRGSAFGW